MSTSEHSSVWLQLVKNFNMGRKSRRRGRIFCNCRKREGEHSGWKRTGRIFSTGRGERKEILWHGTSLEASTGKFMLSGLQNVLKDKR